MRPSSNWQLWHPMTQPPLVDAPCGHERVKTENTPPIGGVLEWRFPLRLAETWWNVKWWEAMSLAHVGQSDLSVGILWVLGPSKLIQFIYCDVWIQDFDPAPTTGVEPVLFLLFLRMNSYLKSLKPVMIGCQDHWNWFIESLSWTLNNSWWCKRCCWHNVSYLGWELPAKGSQGG